MIIGQHREEYTYIRFCQSTGMLLILTLIDEINPQQLEVA